MTEFFVTIVALINGFVVVAIGFLYLNGANIRVSLMMAIACFILGIAGIVFSFVDRFNKRKTKAIAASKNK